MRNTSKGYRIIIAKYQNPRTGKIYCGKRTVRIYEGSTQRTYDANLGLTLRTQFDIRKTLHKNIPPGIAPLT
jgi:hypothetical protein